MAAGGAAAAPEFKVLLTGESGVGKSSILLRFTEDEFDEEQGATIGMDFRQRALAVDGGATATLTLWDTAGQERYRCLTANYYRGTHGICIVYDVTRRDSFAACEAWLAEARQNCGSSGGAAGAGGAGVMVDRTASGGGGSGSSSGGRDPVLLLVANKIDLAEDRQVAREEGAAFAEAHGMLFLECSAKTTTGVQQVFEELARKVFENPQLWDPAAQRAAAAAAAAGGGGGGGGGVAGNSSRVDIGAPGGGAGGEQGYCPC